MALAVCSAYLAICPPTERGDKQEEVEEWVRKERMKGMLKEVNSSKKHVMGKASVFHIALLLLALAGEGMGSESNLNTSNDQDLPQLMLRTKQNEKERSMKRSINLNRSKCV